MSKTSTADCVQCNLNFVWLQQTLNNYALCDCRVHLTLKELIYTFSLVFTLECELFEWDCSSCYTVHPGLPDLVWVSGVALIAKFCVNIAFFRCRMHFSHIAAVTICKTATPIKQVIPHWWMPCHSTRDLLANSVSPQPFKSSQ